MIPRRARIKGIANIPARRKPDATPANCESTVKIEETTPEKKDIKSDNVPNSPSIKKEQIKNTDNVKTEIVAPLINQQSSITNDESTNSEDVTNEIKTQEIKETTVNTTEKKPAVRRWVPKPKPMVRIGTVNRRPKPNLVAQKEKQESSENNQNIENEIPTEKEQECSTAENENNSITEIPEKPSTPNNFTPESPVCNLTSDLNDSRIRSNSESDKISTTPLSPNKIINRTRIRPSPKLIRRNSVQGSASESEDDSRRTYNRIRNDSVCSTTSHTTDNLNTSDSASLKQKLVSIKVNKLFRRSEQSRKVAEARKEFYSKFGNKIPDRKRLTMMDLIYYNPATNPMPQLKPNTTIIQDIPNEPSDETKEDELAEEAEDDPTPDDPKANDEEEDCNPVPQVKVGPNGEIILDEQSLVIEQTGTKKGREQLANSKVIDGDDLNRSYGIYKRPKRAKEWSAMETLRFYRSLNTVGTDFSLMVSLFPGRTRRELKVKFKKEEKLNRSLIDKTLTNPIDFDLSELEKQAKDEEELEARKKLENENKKKEKKDSKRGPYIRKPGSTFSKTMDEENEKLHTPKMRPKRKIKKDRYSILENGLDDIIDSESDSEEEYVIPSKISKTNLAPRSRRLRKGDSDISKRTKRKLNSISSESETENNNLENETNEGNQETETTPNALDLGINLTINEETREVNIFDENQYEDSIAPEEEKNNDKPVENVSNNSVTTENKDDNVEIITVNDDVPTDLSSVEPGSLMILQTEGDDGTPVYKVFMVTPDQQKVEINLGPDVIRSLTSSLGSDEIVTLDLPVVNKSNTEGKSEIAT